MSRFVGVPADQVKSIWHELEPLVARCFRKTDEHRWAPEDVLAGLTDRDMQLWVSIDEAGLCAMLVTRLVAYPRAKECELFLWSGRMTDDWRHQLEIVEAWAKDQGCDYMSTLSRPGSAKFVGYKKGLIRTYRGLK